MINLDDEVLQAIVEDVKSSSLSIEQYFSQLKDRIYTGYVLDSIERIGGGIIMAGASPHFGRRGGLMMQDFDIVETKHALEDFNSVVRRLGLPEEELPKGETKSPNANFNHIRSKQRKDKRCK